MAGQQRVIELDEQSELGRWLRDTSEPTVILALGGLRYALQREEEPPAASERYDPDLVRAALRPLFGVISPQVADAIKRDLYEQRFDSDAEAS